MVAVMKVRKKMGVYGEGERRREVRNVEYCCRRERGVSAEDDEGDDVGDKTNKMLRCQGGFTSLPNTTC